MKSLRTMRISRRIALLIGILFIMAATALLIAINLGMKHNALNEARTQSRIILDRNLAIHVYYSHQLKPQLFQVLEKEIVQGYFDPSWMSSTYAVREINKFSQTLEELDYYYKECAINARSPANEADPYEQAFIQRLNADPELIELAEVRSIDGKPFFAVLRRGETMEHSCLRCHDTPEHAPAGLVARYGGTRSFGRWEGEVVSAVSIRVPLAAAYAQADQLSLQLSLYLILGLTGLYALLIWLQQRQVFAPLSNIAGLVEQIAGDPQRLGEQLPPGDGRELNELTTAFNRMSLGLGESLDQLYEQAEQLQLANRELRQSEEQYRNLLNGIHAAVVVHAADTRILVSNPLAQQLLGLGEADILDKTAGDPDWRFIREDGSVMPLPEYPVNQVIANDQPLRDYLVGICRSDLDKPLWVLVNADPVRDPEGKLDRVIVTFVDLTERRLIEKRLELLDYALNQVREAAFMVDEQARFHYVNAEACRRLGYDRDELLQLRVSDVDPDMPVERWPEHWAEVRNSGSFSFESRHRSKSGEIFPVSIYVSYFEYGGKSYLLSQVRDISETKRAAETLAREKALLRCVIDSVPDLIFIKDGDGFYRGCNKASEQFIGLSEREQIGLSDFDFFDRELAERIRSDDLQVIETGRPLRTENWARYPDGRDVLFESFKVPFVGPDGERHGLVGIARDITEQRKLEAELRQAQKLEAVGHLAGGVAHDFNNMLGVIIGRTELALRRVAPDDRLHTHLQEISKAAQRSADLTRQLLAFASKQAVIPRVLDLNRSVGGMLKMLQRLIGERIELVWQPGAELWQVRIDPSQIDQILANLCVNARDSIAEDGWIRVTTRNLVVSGEQRSGQPDIDPGEYVVLEVIDNGCGIKKELLEHIFEPFFTTKEQGRGTGLGLATVYGIVKQNNGNISVDSAPGAGTTVSICLPRHLGSPEDWHPPVPEGKALQGHETILLVEDEQGILDIIRQALEELGYRVLAAESPTQALQLAAEHQGNVDLLLTDVVMPGMNGWDLAQQLLMHSPGLRYLYMSGYTGDIIANHGILDEGDNFIQKPFTIQALSSKVREVLEDA